jgi:hypothetical protein
MNKLFVTISLVLMTFGVGCAALSHYITPADLDRQALEYAVDAGVSDLNDYDAWYPNLAVVSKLKDDVDSAHMTIQLSLQQQAEKDNLDYSILADTVSNDLLVAQQREEALFGESGLLSMGLSMLGVGGFAGILGLMRKRPGDITKPELEAALLDATGKTKDELSAKDKQFLQIVKGVDVFMDTYKEKDEDVILALKAAMDKTQDVDTKTAVAIVRTEA